MIVTDEILESGKSKNGGWNKKQLLIFGIQSFYSRWKKDLIGKEVADEKIALFLKLKDSHLPKDISLF